MEESLANPQRAVGVRGNMFSFLLPWETVMQKISKVFAEGDLRSWPLDQDTAAQVVRVRFVRGHEALRQQFKELQVRSQVVKGMANLYIENHMEELLKKNSVLRLLSARGGQVREDLKNHIEIRVNAEYPAAMHGGNEGAVPAKLQRILEEASKPVQNSHAVLASSKPVLSSSHTLGASLFDQKQATGHDIAPTNVADLFTGVRPSIVVGEATTKGAVAEEVIVEQAFNKVTGMVVPMGQKFEPQFVASYVPRSAPWALNYSCGGADHPGLFTDWDAPQASDPETRTGSAKPWRRNNQEALLLPGPYAQMLATRPEIQVAADWMLVPSARNLHWRYQVLHSAFIVCKQRLGAEDDKRENLKQLLAATKKILSLIHI